jgi:hypothetical protein
MVKANNIKLSSSLGKARAAEKQRPIRQVPEAYLTASIFLPSDFCRVGRCSAYLDPTDNRSGRATQLSEDNQHQEITSECAHFHTAEILSISAELLL